MGKRMQMAVKSAQTVRPDIKLGNCYLQLDRKRIPMSARDKIHDAVKNALVKDGWTITSDPFIIQYDDVTLQADLAAECL